MKTHLLLAAAAMVLGAAATRVCAADSPVLRQVGQWAGPDGGWDFSAFDAAHRRLYVARSDGVTAVDVDAGTVTPHLLAASRTHAATPVNGGAEILVTEGSTGQALLADATSGQVRARIPTGRKPDSAIVEPATGLALVFDNAGGGITLIDTKAGKAVGVIAVPGALESAAPDGAGKVYVTVEDLNEIMVVDVKHRQVLAHYPLEGCEGPTGLALAPRTRLLVAACANRVAKVVSAGDGKLVASLPIGGRPDWAGYDAKLDAVLIPTGEDGVVNLVSTADPARATVAARPAGHVGSRSGAIDPRTGALYLPAADFQPTPGGRPTATPGSFRIITLAP